MPFFRKPSLSRARVEELKYEAMLVRNERRLTQAKNELTRRGVQLRTPISTGYIPPNVARSFAYTNPRGLA
jgi:hypothetical protein